MYNIDTQNKKLLIQKGDTSIFWLLKISQLQKFCHYISSVLDRRSESARERRRVYEYQCIYDISTYIYTTYVTT